MVAGVHFRDTLDFVRVGGEFQDRMLFRCARREICRHGITARRRIQPLVHVVPGRTKLVSLGSDDAENTQQAFACTLGRVGDCRLQRCFPISGAQLHSRETLGYVNRIFEVKPVLR